MIETIKKRIGIDFLLLFVLVVNYLFTIEKWHNIRYIPLQGPPKNFFFVFFAFAVVVVYFFISLSKIERKKRHYIKTILIVTTIFVLFFSALAYQVVLRKASNNLNFVHDGAVETEEAVKFLSQGKNPYAADYRDTPFGFFRDEYSQGRRDNPAWTHYVYLPFLPLFSLPFYKLSESLFSFYDQRIVYGLLFFISLVFLYKLPEKRNKKIVGLLIFAFNPLFFPYFIQGYNDIFVFFWILVSLYLLKLEKFSWSLAFLALACVSKQSAWLILPFYFFYLYYKEEEVKAFSWKLLSVLKKYLPFFIVGLILLVPFIIWGPGDFFDDIFRYPAGTIASNFPIVGYGISHFIYKMGFIESVWDYYPFWIFQAIFCLPLLYYLIRKLRENNTLSNLVLSYGILLLVFWFFSRFFNDNYFSFLSLIFLAGFLIEEKKEADN